VSPNGLGEATVKLVMATVERAGQEEVCRVLATFGDRPHVCGQNDRSWVADFRWALTGSGWDRLASGAYTRPRPSTHQGDEQQFGYGAHGRTWVPKENPRG
jgi:hypothetical protein